MNNISDYEAHCRDEEFDRVVDERAARAAERERARLSASGHITCPCCGDAWQPDGDEHGDQEVCGDDRLCGVCREGMDV